MVSKKTLFKMKIALVSPHFYPSTKFGGPVISLWGLCKELSNKHEIFVYTTSSGQKKLISMIIFLTKKYIRILSASIIVS